MWTDVFILQLAKQQKFENCEDHLEPFEEKMLTSLEKGGLIKRIKGKKGDSELSKIRITKEGNEILNNVEIAEVTDNDIVLFNWIKGIYLDKEKKLGNQKKTKLYIALFRTHSGIDLNKFAFLLNVFVNDEANMEYNKYLEYAFFRPSNVYSTKFSLDESRLYRYYLERQEYFDEEFEKL